MKILVWCKSTGNKLWEKYYINACILSHLQMDFYHLTCTLMRSILSISGLVLVRIDSMQLVEGDSQVYLLHALLQQISFLSTVLVKTTMHKTIWGMDSVHSTFNLPSQHLTFCDCSSTSQTSSQSMPSCKKNLCSSTLERTISLLSGFTIRTFRRKNRWPSEPSNPSNDRWPSAKNISTVFSQLRETEQRTRAGNSINSRFFSSSAKKSNLNSNALRLQINRNATGSCKKRRRAALKWIRSHLSLWKRRHPSKRTLNSMPIIIWYMKKWRYPVIESKRNPLKLLLPNP